MHGFKMVCITFKSKKKQLFYKFVVDKFGDRKGIFPFFCIIAICFLVLKSNSLVQTIEKLFRFKHEALI
jgi:hypothetical protein